MLSISCIKLICRVSFIGRYSLLTPRSSNPRRCLRRKRSVKSSHARQLRYSPAENALLAQELDFVLDFEKQNYLTDHILVQLGF